MTGEYNALFLYSKALYTVRTESDSLAPCHGLLSTTYVQMFAIFGCLSGAINDEDYNDHRDGQSYTAESIISTTVLSLKNNLFKGFNINKVKILVFTEKRRRRHNSGVLPRCL